MITAQEIFLIFERNTGDVITVNGTEYTVGNGSSFDSIADAVEADAVKTSNTDAVIFTNLGTTKEDISSLDPLYGQTAGANLIFNGAFSGSLRGTVSTDGTAGIVLLTFSGSDTVGAFDYFAPWDRAVTDSGLYITVSNGAKVTGDTAVFVSGSEMLVTDRGSQFHTDDLVMTGGLLAATSDSTLSLAGGRISGYGTKVAADRNSLLYMTNITVENEAQIAAEDAKVFVKNALTLSGGSLLTLKNGSLTLAQDDTVITLSGGKIALKGTAEFEFSSGGIVLAAGSKNNEITVSDGASLRVGILNASAAGSDALTVKLEITEETATDQVMLTVGGLGGSWSLTEENYYVWEGTPVNVLVTLGDGFEAIDQRYKLMDAEIEYKNIKINITQEMADLGYCVIRTADGIYLSERKIDMSTIIVNSEWAGQSGEVTYNGETYTIGTNAFATYESAVDTIKQQAEKPVSIIVNTPGSAITFSDATVSARFSGGKSVVTDVTVTAGDIGVSWDGSLTYTGNVSGTGTFKVDFTGFNDANLDKESVYTLLYGAEATGSSSATLVNENELIAGWNQKVVDGSVLLWNDALFADADLVIDATLAGKKQGYTYTVNGKSYTYGLTAYTSVSTAKASELTTSNPASVTFVGDTGMSDISGLNSGNKAWTGMNITVTGDLSYAGNIPVGEEGYPTGSLKVQGKISGTMDATITINCSNNSDKLLVTNGIEGVSKITATVTGEGNDKISLGAITGGSGEKVMEIISSDVTATSVTGNVKVSGNLNVKDVSAAGDLTAGSIILSGSSALKINEKLVLEDGGNTASKATDLITTDSGDAAELLLSASDTLTISNLTVKKDLTIGDMENGYTGLVLLTGKNTTLTVDAGKTLTVSAEQAIRFMKFKNFNIGSGAKLVIRGGALNVEEMNEATEFFKGNGFSNVGFEDTTLSDVENITVNAKGSSLDDISGIFNSGTFNGTVGNNKLDIAKGEDGDLSNYSYDMLGGKNTVNVGTGVVLEMIDIKNATTVTIANGVTGDAASTGMVLSGALVTSAGAATVKAGNFTTTVIKGVKQEDGSYVAIGKNQNGGNNTISFGNGASAELGGDLIAVKSLTLGNSTADDTAILTVGYHDGNSYIGGSGNIYGQNSNNSIKTGTWSTANIYGDIDLGGGANTVTVGGFSIFNVDSVKNVKTFTVGNGGLNKLNSGSWDRSAVTIDGNYEAPLMANAITIGNYADMTITGVINNGGVMSASGTTIKVGSASTLSVGATAASLVAPGATVLAIDGLAGLTLSAGKMDETSMVATEADIYGSITGTEAKDMISLAANSSLYVKGSMDLLGGANAVTVAAKAALSVEGALQNVNALTLGAGGVNKGDEVVTSGENKAIVTINGNLTGSEGSNKLTVGNHAEFSASNIYLSELGGNFTVTVGSNAKFESGVIEGVNKLTIGNGIAFAYEAGGAKDQVYTQFASGMISGTTGNDTITIGNYTDTSIAAFSLGKGNDTVKIGNFNSRENNYEADVNILGGIDLGAGKNTLSIGTQSCLNTAMIEGVNNLSLAAGKATADGNYYTEIYCSGITGSELADTITIGKLANLYVDGDIDLTAGEEAGMKNAINLGSLGTLQAGDVTGVNKLTVGAGTFNKTDESVEWTKLDINDLTGTELDDVFSAGNYSLFSVDSIDGAGSVKGDKLTIGQGVTAIFRGTISNIDTITIGNNTEVYASKEAMNILKDAAGDNDTITWYDIGSADVAKGFTDAKSENADDEGIDTREGAVFQNGTNGWLSNGDIQDFVDYIQLSDDGTWEITDAGSNLNVTLHEITTSGLTEITTAANVSYEYGKWTISDYDAETMVVCVEIAKVDEVTKTGTFGYTTTLA